MTDARSGHRRPVVTLTLGLTWCLHLDNVNLALDHLVKELVAEECAYSVHRPTS